MRQNKYISIFVNLHVTLNSYFLYIHYSRFIIFFFIILSLLSHSILTLFWLWLMRIWSYLAEKCIIARFLICSIATLCAKFSTQFSFAIIFQHPFLYMFPFTQFLSVPIYDLLLISKSDALTNFLHFHLFSTLTLSSPKNYKINHRQIYDRYSWYKISYRLSKV